MKTLAAALAVLFLSAVPVAAQGKGKAAGKGRSGPSTGSSAAPLGPQGSSATETAARQFGSWLDDASLLDPGNAWASISLGHFRTIGGSQTDFPVADASFGVTRDLQVGGSVPYYRMSFADGSALRGMGDVTLHAKFSLIDPTTAKSKVGLAVGSVVEVLQQGAGTSRLAWGVPVNIEWRANRYRVFGSSGFFSRGALFSSGALELPVSQRVVVTAALAHMRSVKGDPTADALNVPKTRTDLTGVAAYFVRPTIAVFGGGGRTISELNASATSLMITGGLSVTFAPHIVR